jgi:membrane protease subunit (stomatin/prohibitin family)
LVNLFISEGTTQHSAGNVGKAHAQRIISLVAQTQTQAGQPAHGAAPLSQADELAKFKKLLDDGVLTQEEFDRKKSQILGL